ncbi:MAG: hypothetical protein HYW65_02115 [Candidatus Liptonbacteria bacterium]|nr:hypothetical protein [Candidatus Liptonbacteria bacterium]
MNISKIKIAILCGGPSLERGISLNSARSVLDHLSSENIEIVPVYFDSKKNAYRVSRAQLYSNTPSDFDFKLQETATPLSTQSFLALLRSVHLVFPIMHGHFGEDGGIQSFLEEHDIPFIGSTAETCKISFDKFYANEFLCEKGFYTLPSAAVSIHGRNHRKIVEEFFKEHGIKRAIVKPARGGSSIGVFSVSTPAEALGKIRFLFSKRMDTRLVLEPFAEGVEFTTILLENRFGSPVALPPTEIETDYTKHQIFDFRRKYLPTRQVIYHCPPRFDDEVIEKIQASAEQLFALFKMRDFGRFDGWVLPDGNIWFCDFNTISGMEQNSFLFQQSSRVGMTHKDVLRYIVKNACARYEIKIPEEIPDTNSKKKKVNVLFGGGTSERQVSLMSGTNVWLKLRSSLKYAPQPHLLDQEENVWRLPYQLTLNHTVEEIAENCRNYEKAKKRLESFEKRARLRLGLPENKNPEEFFPPRKMPMAQFIKESRFIFNALHGGKGEGGAFQKLFSKKGIRFNGPNAKVSRLCMDKWATSQAIHKLQIEGVDSIPERILEIAELRKLSQSELKRFWKALRKDLGAETVIVKPRADGCSTGIVHLFSSTDLQKYLNLLASKTSHAPRNTFKHQPEIIEMPTETLKELLFERFIESDILRVKHNSLKYRRKSGWVEITVGVVEKNGKLHAFNPSITIAEGEVLSVEEKFQGGTGVNITPPPPEIMKPRTLQKIRERIEQVAAKIGIEGCARIDAFANVKTGRLLVIEINTLPGLTPSTVFYHQALAGRPPVFPREILELLIQNKGY